MMRLQRRVKMTLIPALMHNTTIPTSTSRYVLGEVVVYLPNRSDIEWQKPGVSRPALTFAAALPAGGSTFTVAFLLTFVRARRLGTLGTGIPTSVGSVTAKHYSMNQSYVKFPTAMP
eukprot:5869201-Amphidinium_carterae.1